MILRKTLMRSPVSIVAHRAPSWDDMRGAVIAASSRRQAAALDIYDALTCYRRETREIHLFFLNFSTPLIAHECVHAVDAICELTGHRYCLGVEWQARMVERLVRDVMARKGWARHDA